MAEPLLIAKSDKDIFLEPRMANRHGIIAGATGTGKTVTLQVMAERFSEIGVPVFMADVKGDLSGISKAGTAGEKIQARLAQMGISNHAFAGYPVKFWDIFGTGGHPIRSTVSELGPLLLSRILDLNDVQSATLSVIFKLADDNGLLLLDMKDIRAITQYTAEHVDEVTKEYGLVSASTVGAIQRALLTLDEQGASKLFGEPAIELGDFMQTSPDGRGVINILCADKLILSPKVYSTFLLWLLSELFETMPEVGDPDKPKMVFFFDEAHLLFNNAPKVLLEKIEQVVRLIRSKGVGIYFVSQNPLDVPDVILGQLGNRVQHALRAFTPRDQKAVAAAAETFRPNPALNVSQAITELGVGEALVSFLDASGTPGIVERAFVCPPHSQIGPITPEERKALIQSSNVYGKYEQEIDRESAYEVLKSRAEQATQAAPQQPVTPQVPYPNQQAAAPQTQRGLGRVLPRGAASGIVGSFVGSAARSAGYSIGGAIMRGILGSIIK